DLLVGRTGEVWDLEAGQRIGTHRFRALERVTTQPGSAVAYAWDRTGDAPSRFRDVLSGDTVSRIGRDDELRAGEQAFSSDGALFAAARPIGLGVWDVASGSQVMKVDGGAPFDHVA